MNHVERGGADLHAGAEVMQQEQRPAGHGDDPENHAAQDEQQHDGRDEGRDEAGEHAALGVLLCAAYGVQTFGLMDTTPGKNAFLAATYCVFVPFFWWLIHKRRPDRYNLAAALLCLCGMGVVSLQSDLRIGRGEGLTILSGVFYALHIIATASAARGRSPVLLSFVQFAVAAVLSWVTAPFAAPAPEEKEEKHEEN